MRNELPRLSIVIPCYNEESNVSQIFNAIAALELPNNYEIIFINDGSKDDTWLNITKLLKKHKEFDVIGINFSRNFGKESAIDAGLSHAYGDVVITIDADLQHPIELIPKMIEMWLKNDDIFIINGVKSSRQSENFIKRFFVYWYYFLLNKSTGLDLKNHSDFKLLDRKVVDAYIKLDEKNKFYRGLTRWMGFASIDLRFKPNNRINDENSWSIWSLFKYAKSSILSFSHIPLKIITWLGLLLFLFSIGLTIDTLIKKFNQSSAEGFPTIIILQLGIGSLILFSLGIIGEYLSEIYKEIKRRPTYLISKKTSKNKDD